MPRGNFNDCWAPGEEGRRQRQEQRQQEYWSAIDDADPGFGDSVYRGSTNMSDRIHCQVCRENWEILTQTVLENFPALLRQFEAGLSVCGFLGLCSRWKPLGIVFEGSSGAGKTLGLTCIDGSENKAVKNLLYRSDRFTMASFVSQAANVSGEDLENIDLLPRIRHKILITPEMGPMFRGKKDEIQQTFALVARVMDGRGLILDSGTHGRRGYEGYYPFGWLGATTHLDDMAFEAMSNVGNRLLLFDTAPPRPTVQQLAAFAQKGGSSSSETTCSLACAYVLSHFFESHVIQKQDKITKLWTDEGSLPDATLSDHSASYIAVAATAISRLRSKNPEQAEYEFRLVEQLSLLAGGRAAIEGCSEVLPAHLELIRHVTFSAAKWGVRPILAALLNTFQGSELTVSEVQELCSCVKATALDRMKTLASFRICSFQEGKAPKSQSTISLADSFALLARERSAEDDPLSIV